MSAFRLGEKPGKKLGRKILAGVILILVFLIVATLFWFINSLKPVDANDTTEQIVTINPDTSDAAVSIQLQDKGLINSSVSFQIYARVNGKHGNIQAGGYRLSKSMSVSEILNKITNGEIAVDLVTILPAQRLDQLIEAFKEAGYSETEVQEALMPDKYSNHPALKDKPPLSNLEGYLYPESFNKTVDTPLEVIIRASLDQTSLVLTPELVEKFKEKNLDIHEAVILASIVEREVNNPEDRAKVAQVFLKRLREGIPLGSDPTALNGALLFDMEPSVNADTPYNTRLYEGLPPGPINNISADSLRAVANPAETDYLFFVSGDDGKTYFSNNLQDHEALTKQHCIELCKSY